MVRTHTVMNARGATLVIIASLAVSALSPIDVSALKVGLGMHYLGGGYPSQYSPRTNYSLPLYPTYPNAFEEASVFTEVVPDDETGYGRGLGYGDIYDASDNEVEVEDSYCSSLSSCLPAFDWLGYGSRGSTVSSKKITTPLSAPSPPPSPPPPAAPSAPPLAPQVATMHRDAVAAPIRPVAAVPSIVAQIRDKFTLDEFDNKLRELVKTDSTDGEIDWKSVKSQLNKVKKRVPKQFKDYRADKNGKRVPYININKIKGRLQVLKDVQKNSGAPTPALQDLRLRDAPPPRPKRASRGNAGRRGRQF